MGDSQGLQNGGGLYSAVYSGGNTFNELVSSGPYGVGASASDGGAQDIPNVGFSPVGATVNDMSSQWHLMLTAGDLAGGTSNYTIWSLAPSRLPLPGLSGLVASRPPR